MSQILIGDDRPCLHELASQGLMADGCVVRDFFHIFLQVTVSCKFKLLKVGKVTRIL
jgi:hypothetical protein